MEFLLECIFGSVLASVGLFVKYISQEIATTNQERTTSFVRIRRFHLPDIFQNEAGS